MQVTKVTCDHCGKDLTTTGNCEDYRLCLRNESIPSKGGVVTAMAKYPSFDYDHHFCRDVCLARWVFRNYNSDGHEKHPAEKEK